MIKNKFGQIILEEDDLIDHVMTDPNKEIKHALVKDVDLKPVAELVDNIHKYVKYQEVDTTVEEFDQTLQSEWNMPAGYKSMDIAQHILDLCDGDEPKLQRVGKELLMYQERGLFNLLKYLKYLVDTMQDNKVIWGVGRGSSCASYVLYLLGIHRVDSMFYNLDVEEFLR